MQIKMDRNTSGIGQYLEIEAGGSQAGAVNNAGGVLRLSAGISTGAAAGSDIQFYTSTPGAPGTDDRPQTEKMVIRANGYVGIGVSTPTFPLDIQTAPVNTGGATAGRYFNDGTGINVASGGGNVNISVRATGGFWSNAGGIDGGFYANSDVRIKNIVGLSNSAQDLATLNKVEVTNYSYKDTLDSGSRVVKGVIAQQLETVYPQAISKQTNIVPDIYALAETVSLDSAAKTLTVTLGKPFDLKAGENVRLIGSDNSDKQYEVIAVSGQTFTVKDWTATAEKVFVYGKEVSDFRIVDYDRLFTLGVSAIQELSKKVDALETANSTLTDENQRLKAESTDAKTRLTDLEQRMANLEKLLMQNAAANSNR
jgi:hypothetical protein